MSSSEARSANPLFQVVFVLVVILLFVVISKLYLDGHMEIKRLEASLQAEEQKQVDLETTAKTLDSEIRLLRTDEGVEMVARDKLRFIRPDEVVVVPLQ